MAMFIEDRTDLQHQRVVYAHCDPGCGMEYELDPESGVLQSWHDGVGQVTRTTLSGPHQWDELVASHAGHEHEDVQARYRAAADAAGLGIMAEVLDVVMDREQVSLDLLGALDADRVTALYFTHIAPAIDRMQEDITTSEGVYEQCAACHLFVVPNDADDSAGPVAAWLHLHRGTPDDEALDGTHPAAPSGRTGTLAYWREHGPNAMRARFITEGS